MSPSKATASGLYFSRKRHRQFHLPNIRGAVNMASAILSIPRIVTEREADAEFLMSFWFRRATPWPATLQGLFQVQTTGQTPGFYLSNDAGAKDYYFETADDAYTKVLSSAGLVANAEDNWHNAIIAAKTNFDAGLKTLQIYIDDADVAAVSDPNAAFTNPFNGLELRFNGTSLGELLFDFDLAEVWMGLEYLDISDAANRLKFRTAQGHPAQMGNRGELVTGNVPEVYLSGDHTNFHVNKGLSEDATITGTLGAASVSPWG